MPNYPKIELTLWVLVHISAVSCQCQVFYIRKWSFFKSKQCLIFLTNHICDRCPTWLLIVKAGRMHKMFEGDSINNCKWKWVFYNHVNECPRYFHIYSISPPPKMEIKNSVTKLITAMSNLFVISLWNMSVGVQFFKASFDGRWFWSSLNAV